MVKEELEQGQCYEIVIIIGHNGYCMMDREEQKQKLATKPEVEKELEGIVSELAKREE